MTSSLVARAAIAAALVVVSAARSEAQIYETFGIRAQGMGGAFVAVADDATATWWNPAGMASGAYGNGLIEYGVTQDPKVATDANGALPSWRSSTRSVAVAFPAGGVSYYRVQIGQIHPVEATAAGGLVRQDQGRASVRSTSLALQQIGATFAQSAGEHLVLGSTVKVVRGGFASAAGVATEASLDGASALATKSELHTDLDVGAMAKLGPLRLGLAAKNLRHPTFGSGDDAFTLGRQVRAGLAVIGAQRGAVGPFTVAMDADLSRTPTATGDARHLAVGGEAWMFGRSLGLRGGLSRQTIGEARSVLSGGASLALRSGVYVDAEGTFGSDTERKGWGFALRATF